MGWPLFGAYAGVVIPYMIPCVIPDEGLRAGEDQGQGRAKGGVGLARKLDLCLVGPIGPCWVHLGIAEPIRLGFSGPIHLGAVGPCWAHSFKLFWAHSIGHCWAHLGIVGPIWALLGPLI